MASIDRAIDALNDKAGYVAAFLMIPLIAVIVFEVAMRYLFNAPTLWAFEVTNFLFGVNFMLGFAYAHKSGGHVAVDVFEARLSLRARARLRIVTNALFFLPTTLVFSAGAVIYAASSWAVWERNSTSWAPALYPYKTFMALGFVALLLQGVSKLVADVRLLRAQGPAAAEEVPAARMAGGAR